MHVNTFYDRVKEKYGICFTEYSALKRCQGDSLLHAKQYEKAMSGDNTLLIWLGKVRLNQTEYQQLLVAPNQTTVDLSDINIRQQAKIVELEKKLADAGK